MRKNKSEKCIIRSGGRILGPYFEREIIELLRNRQVVVLDEMSRPCGRWMFIRDVPELAKVIEEMRVKNVRSVMDDTTTAGLDYDSTQTATPILEDDKTLDISTDAVNSQSSVQDIMFQSIDDLSLNRPKGSARDTYTHAGDVRIQMQSDRTAKWVWMTSIILILATTGFVLFSRFVAKPIQQKAVMDQNTLEAIDALEDGNYDKALELFESAHRIDTKDRSLYLYLGILRIQAGEQPVSGLKILNEIKNAPGVDHRKVFAGIGIVHLYDRDFATAEQYFKQALDIDPLYHFSTINLGALALEKGEYAEANNHLMLAVKEGSQDGAELLMLAKVAEALYLKNKQSKPVQDVIRSLKNFGEANTNYRLEIAITMSYLQTLIGEKVDFDKRVNSILDLDPWATENHRQNLFIYRKAVGWSQINQWCLKMTDKFDPIPRVIALEALCLMKAGDHAESMRKIEGAVSQKANDPLVQSINAYILYFMKSPVKAMVSAERAVDADHEKNFVQPRRIAALLCKEADKSECMMTMLREVNVIDPQSIDAIAGIAEYYLKSRNFNVAQEWVDKALKISDSYKPILPLARRLTKMSNQSQGRGL
jgi:tetratricopeptide (TPR) repeat protein